MRSSSVAASRTSACASCRRRQAGSTSSTSPTSAGVGARPSSTNRAYVRLRIPMSASSMLERYADLIVSVGANVQPDQVLAVEALPEAAPLVHAIARRAYEKGARYVDVQYFDGLVKRIRAETARVESLDWVPPWLGRRMELLGELDAARCVLVPLVPPGLLDGVDPARAGIDRLPSIEQTFKTIDERSVAWTLSPFPARGWAALVY